MKKIVLKISAIILITLGFISCSCGNNNQSEEATEITETNDNIKTNRKMAFDIKSLSEEPIFNIVTNLGTIQVKLYSKTPAHRDNFVKLASEKFFDGILFHRVINGFMIQAGDPYTKNPADSSKFGQGGPGYTVPAEIVKEYYHKKGALAAARRGDAANPTKASSGSQFYLVQDENNCLSLDYEYTVFGETIKGLDIIDKIAAVDTDRWDRPYEDIRIISVLPELE